MEALVKHRYTEAYLWSLIVSGVGAVCYSIYRIDSSQLNWRFAALLVITTVLGSRVSVKIPGLSSHISTADTFIFLTMLLCGGEAAVLLAAADGFCMSLQFTRKKQIFLLNLSVTALSTFLTLWLLRAIFGPVESLLSSGYSATFISSLCLMGLAQYLINSSLVAVGIAFKTGQPIWQTWRKNYLWTSITYFAGVSAAGIISKLIGVIGFPAFIAATPIIAIVYLTYRTYLKNIESASRHVAELQESEERFRSAFDNSAIGMALVSPEGRWLQVNRSLCEIVGYSEQELLASDFQSITHQEDLGTVLAHIQQLLDGQIQTYQTEKRYLHKTGEEVWIHLSVSRIRDARSKGLGLIFQIQDITDRKRAEWQLMHDAFHDSLTGLPNRALFVDRLKQALARTKRLGSHRFAVLFLDLDRFKIINDSLGHLVGDQLLIGIARRLETCLRPGDTVARLGGDEFTILLEDVQDTGEAIGVAMRVEQELSLPFNLGGHEVFTTVSIGIAPSDTGYDRPDDILRDADTAMYRAKSLGKSRHEVFDKAMHANALNILQLETDLRRALERREFLLHYQPIVSFETGTVSGFEALVRWQHPKYGFIAPAEFIPIAEETGIIVPLGRWVLTEACRQMREWQDESPAFRGLSVSVNLSGKQLTQPDLAAQVKQTLDDTGMDAACLKLEITESLLMEDFAAETLNQLRELGVESSIDDFGTGYSSLSYLHRLPISTLKIDRSFISRMTDQTENGEIVRTIVALARNLGVSVIAEGVETQEQIAALKRMNCDSGQGYFFSKPCGAEAVHALVSEMPQWAMNEPTVELAFRIRSRHDLMLKTA